MGYCGQCFPERHPAALREGLEVLPLLLHGNDSMGVVRVDLGHMTSLIEWRDTRCVSHLG